MKTKKSTTDELKPLPIVSSSSTRRFAWIYGTEEGEVLDSQSSSSSSEATTNASQQGKLPSNVLQAVSSQVSMSTLIRLACAFALPPHDTIHPKMVKSANLVSIDPTKMEIALAVPSDDEGTTTLGGGGGSSASLVQILVPVLFPATLPQKQQLEKDDDDDDDDTSLLETSTLLILETIQQLDEQAKQTIGNSERQHELEQNKYEDIENQQRILKELRQEPYADELPNWWTWPELRIGLEKECQSMKGLLNEDDFASDLRSLCRIHSRSNTAEEEEEESDKSNVRIVQACVAAVGPSGLFLRALVEEEQTQVNSIEEQSGNNKNPNRINVGIAFPKEATSADSLREAIVDLVESVEDIVEEPTIVHSEVALLGSGTDEEDLEEKPELVPTPAEKAIVVEEASLALQDKAVDNDEDEESEEESLEEIELSNPKEFPTADDIAQARQQPKSPEVQAKLASKYAAIEEVGERAYAILKDLYMI